ncbi:MAG: Gfo/Idh/MocA family protein [Candidatus Woesearchaeota archaeon]
MKLTSYKTLKIIQYILDNNQFTQTEVSNNADVSIGQVNKVFKYLLEKNIIQKNKKNYSLVDKLTLLKAISFFTDKDKNFKKLKNTNGKKLINLALDNDFNKIHSILYPQKNRKTLKCAIIGYGTWGKYHYKTINKFNNIELKAICDIKNKETKESINFYNNYHELLNNEILDFIIISTPSKFHLEILKEAKKNNIPALCEIPTTENKSQFKEIIDYDKLFCGLTEMFNPVIIKLKELLKNEKINYVEFYRKGPKPLENRNKSALFHLGYNELFFVNELIDDIIFSEGISNSEKDIFRLILKSRKDILVNINLDWSTSEKKRKYIFGCDDKTIECDLIKQEIKIYYGVKRKQSYTYDEQIKGVRSGKVEIIKTKKREPLMNEYSSFLEFLKNKKQSKDNFLKAFELLDKLN